MDDKRRDLCRYRLDKAEKCLESAKILVQANDYYSAANRSYYSIFHGIRSLLAFEIRSESDYDDYYVISKEEVGNQIENVQFFLNGITMYVDSILWTWYRST